MITLPSRAAGFTLIEIMVAVLIISILSIVATSSISTQRARARDARRASDISAIQVAIENYVDQKITAPSYPNDNGTGWDLSSVGNFIAPLVSEGFMSKVPVDPINNATDQFEYRYKYNTSESMAVGGQNYTFYELKAQKMETNAAAPAVKSPVKPT